MQEIELKFQIPESAREAVRQAVAAEGAGCTSLRARYLDTADRLLARSGFAIRLRQEGESWVQTLKGGGDGLMRRLEHNAVFDPGTAEPTLDLQRHAGTPAGEALERLLSGAGRRAADLQLQYRTDIRRLHCIVGHPGARVELALDEGEITGGRDGRVEVHELEFELVEGEAQALVALAAEWVDRFGLWLDVRTKAERGDRLARGLTSGAPVRARPQGATDVTAPLAGALALRQVMQHVLPNASELSDGLGGAGHLDELRAGLSGLAAVADRVDATVDRDSSAPWTSVSQASSELLDRLTVSAGPSAEVTSAGALLRAPSTQQLWLQALNLSLSAPV